jgi:uncharacterized protein (DUF885 family)
MTLIVACVVAFVLVGCGEKPPLPTKPDEDAQFAALEHDYVVYFMSRFPVVATYLGGSAFDSSLAKVDETLRDHSAEGIAQEDARWIDYRSRFTALDPQALSPRRRIDLSVALAQIEFLLHQHQTRRYQQRALDTYVDEPFRGIDWQIQGMTPTGDHTYGSAAEWQQVVARVRAVPSYLATAQQQIAAGIADRNTPDWRVVMQFGLRSTVADADYFAKTLPGIAAQDMTGPTRPVLLKELQAAGIQAADAYTKLRDFIATAFFQDPRKSDVSALKPEFQADRYALGGPEYDWALHNNLRLEQSAQQLYEQSWPIVEETRATMIALAGEIAASHRWNVPADGPAAVQVVFDQLSQDAPGNDEEMIESYRQVGMRLVDYARRTGLFDVPDQYRLDVTVTPPPLESGIDGAAYYPAPPFKATGVGRFYVTPTHNDIAQLRQQHNRAAIADLAAHEGFPGHDWHYKVMSQHRAEISAVRWLTPGAVEDSSSMWQDSMAAEGWALYSEALVGEPQPGAANGFYTPEERLYQLRGKLYRDLRVRIDTGIHTQQMPFEDAVTLFSEVVDFQPGSCTDPRALKNAAKQASCDSARSAVTRYSRWPTQAITYRLGKDQIYALRAQAQRKLGEKFSAKRFHLEFMKQGTIPAGYFGDELLLTLEK